METNQDHPRTLRHILLCVSCSYRTPALDGRRLTRMRPLDPAALDVPMPAAGPLVLEPEPPTVAEMRATAERRYSDLLGQAQASIERALRLVDGGK